MVESQKEYFGMVVAAFTSKSQTLPAWVFESFGILSNIIYILIILSVCQLSVVVAIIFSKYF